MSECAAREHSIVVVAASAGGLGALCAIVGALPADFAGTLLIVQHIGSRQSNLPEILTAVGPLPASHGQDGEVLAGGRIYIAPPDHHMTLSQGRIRLDRGPKQHFTRPAADPLFQSAAAAYGSRVIGIVLTGGDSDGTAGLRAITARGGVGIVQDPAEAQVPQMPERAISGDHPDYCLPARAIGPLLQRLARPAARSHVD